MDLFDILVATALSGGGSSGGSATFTDDELTLSSGTAKEVTVTSEQFAELLKLLDDYPLDNKVTLIVN